MLDSTNKSPARRLFQDNSNRSPSSVGDSSSSLSIPGNNVNSSSTSYNEDSCHDTMTHRALLKNELLKHSIIDIRVRKVCFSFFI